jgi:hypothetical protein
VSQSGLNQSYSQLPQERQYQVSLDKGLTDLNSTLFVEFFQKRTVLEEDCSGSYLGASVITIVRLVNFVN